MYAPMHVGINHSTGASEILEKITLITYANACVVSSPIKTVDGGPAQGSLPEGWELRV